MEHPRPHGPAGTRGRREGVSGVAASLVAWSGAALFACSLGYFVYAYVDRFGEAAESTAVWPPVLFDLTLFTAFAAHHSLFARIGLRRLMERLAGGLERSVYTWISSALFLLVCYAWRPIPGDLYRLEGPPRLIALAVQAAGVVLTALGSRALDVFDLAGVRQAAGMAAGNRRAPVLVTSGAFRLVRHPLYLGWALFVFGAPHMSATRAVFAAVSTLYLAIAIPWEERGLEARFGPDYDAYRARVRWRMIPGLY